MSKKLQKIPTIYNYVKAYKPIEVPWAVWTVFGENCQEIGFSNEEVCLGEDYVSLERARTAIEFYVKQLNGVVEWKND